MSIEAGLNKFIALAGDDEDQMKWLRRIKKEILKAVEKQTGKLPEWKEGKAPEDDISLALGGWSNLAQFQRYAAYLAIKGVPPDAPVSDDDLETDEYLMRYSTPTEETLPKEEPVKFRHLLMTGNIIYYVPLEFSEELIIIEEGSDEITSAGSSYRLYQELEEINKHLQMPGDYGELGDEEAWKFYDNEDDPWRFVNWTWIVLHWMARESINTKLSMRVGE